jgi:hypothetical protein
VRATSNAALGETLCQLTGPHLFNPGAAHNGKIEDKPVKRMHAISGAAVLTTEFLKTLLDFPPRQEPGSFSVDKVIEQMQAARAGGK